MEEINKLIEKKDKLLIELEKELDGVSDANKKGILLFKKNEILNTKIELINLANSLIIKNRDIPNKINIDNNKDNSTEENIKPRKRKKDSFSSNETNNDSGEYLIKKNSKGEKTFRKIYNKKNSKKIADIKYINNDNNKKIKEKNKFERIKKENIIDTIQLSKNFDFEKTIIYIHGKVKIFKLLIQKKMNMEI